MDASLQLGEIDDVLRRVDEIVDWSLTHGSRLGYFAAMYYRMTADVRTAIVEGRFDDGQRMVRFDAAFAEYYFRAFEAHRDGQAVSQPWAVALQAAQWPKPLVLQHLLLAMNAHINFDLGLTVVEVQPAERLDGLRRDFDTINQILSALLHRVQASLNRVSPLLGLLDWIGHHSDEALANFSIQLARNGAWHFAEELSRTPEPERASTIAERQALVARLAVSLAKPRFPVNSLVSAIGLFESRSVTRVVETLRTETAP